MFTVQARRSGASLNGVCHRCVVNGNGLGADEYAGQSKTGGMVTQVSSMLTMPFTSIPGFSMASKMAGKMGFDVNPLSLALATFTGGMSLLPGVSKILGGLFKHATYFGDCMKWWTDSNIRGMVAGITPYGINVEEILSMFPEAKREYQLEHADLFSITKDSEYSEVVSALNIGNRQNKITNLYVGAVRSNPDLIGMQCAVQAKSKGEDTGVDMSQSEIDGYWAQIKEAARQQEYLNTVEEVTRTVTRILTRMLAQYQAAAARKVAVIQQTREAGLITGSKGFQLPEGVTSISKGGALILDVNKSTNQVIDYGDIGKKSPTSTKVVPRDLFAGTGFMRGKLFK